MDENFPFGTFHTTVCTVMAAPEEKFNFALKSPTIYPSLVVSLALGAFSHSPHSMELSHPARKKIVPTYLPLLCFYLPRMETSFFQAGVRWRKTFPYAVSPRGRVSFLWTNRSMMEQKIRQFVGYTVNSLFSKLPVQKPSTTLIRHTKRD